MTQTSNASIVLVKLVSFVLCILCGTKNCSLEDMRTENRLLITVCPPLLFKIQFNLGPKEDFLSWHVIHLGFEQRCDTNICSLGIFMEMAVLHYQRCHCFVFLCLFPLFFLWKKTYF